MKKFKPESKILYEKRAAFVTLRKNGNLRGCIGHLVAQLPLYETISQMALSAAFNDYRFSRVTKEELKDIKIEISVLSPLKKIKEIEEIKMGRDGVIVEKSGNSGIFLPQVATETGWSKEEFLNHLCGDKAGLPANAWKDKDTVIYTFTVVKFEEK
ncbi:MAG: AmmeMemoRadiSam system protein A [Candidatus Firestonebacteria bacterium]